MQTLEPSARPNRLPSLTGMRFVAAFAVLISHLDSQIVGTFHPDPPYRVITTLGPVGVAFFFVLSGFILTWVADPDDTARLFWRRRLVKLYPNHLVTFVAARILMVAAGVQIVAINTFPALFLIEPWIPYLEPHGGFTGSNAVSWSLGCEMAFYLAFPWLIRLIGSIRPSRLWLWVAVVVTASTAVPFISQLLPAQPFTSWDPTSSEWQSWFAYLFPLPRMLEFVLGILMARIVITGKWIRLGMTPAFLLTITCVVVQSYLPGVFHLRAGPTALAVAFAIAASASADIRGARTPFSGRIMVWLGEISYALYMVHYLVVQYGPVDALHATGEVTASLSTRLINILLTVVISISLAAALYMLVERPAVRRFSRPAGRRKGLEPLSPST
ncbi:acyltransferase family protein [Streptomyces sp. NPDC051658]|uniref:acyltransferase family protein n=1 Tax=unclassified Streptomyces TaxID=2593676 RepID=UPI00379DCEA3|nr:acyltransferase [Streptomyces sp. NBC_00984]